jgi:hypothetical protein
MQYDDKKELAHRLKSFAHGDEEYTKITRLEAKELSDTLFKTL